VKAYKLELLVLDFENYGEEELKMLAMNARGLDPTVISIEGRDIGEWTDNHPLNKRSTADAEFKRLFTPSSAPTARQSIDSPEFRALPPWPEPINAAAHEQETVAPWVTGKQIVDALHSLGIDTEMSKYGFGAIQVCGTNVPNIRRLIAKLAGRSAGDAVPAGWREFIEFCATTAGKDVDGNGLAYRAKELLGAAPAPGNTETAQPAKAYINERAAEFIRMGCSTSALLSAVPTEVETVVVHVAPGPSKKT
jgi:hypothetical protein